MASRLGSALGGAGTGAGIGASIGSIFPGPGTAIGAAIGAQIGAAVGFISGDQAKRKEKKAQDRAEAIPPIDVSQTAFLDELKREKRAIETGFTPEFVVARDLINQATASGIDASLAAGGGSPALSLMAINRLQAGAGDNVNKLLATLGASKGAYMSAIADYVDKIAQRKLDVETYKTAQELAVATQEMADVNANTHMGMMLGVNTLQDANVNDLWAQLVSTQTGGVPVSSVTPDMSLAQPGPELLGLGENITGFSWDIPGMSTDLIGG